LLGRRAALTPDTLEVVVTITRKVLTSIAALVVGAAAIPEIVYAAPPVPGGETTVLTLPAGEYCAFAIELTLVSNEKTHDSGHGDVVYTGALRGTAKNLASGVVRTYNLSGPGFDEGNTITGPQLIGQPASRNVGPPFLIVNYGRVTFTPDFTIASRTGSFTDICADLS